MNMRSTLYTIAAFLAAPLVVAFVTALGTPVTDTIQAPIGVINGDPISVLGLTFAFYLLALPIGSFFAVPAFLVLRRFNLIRWWSALAAGGAIGFLGSFLITLSRVLRTGEIYREFPAYFTYAITGAVAALLFWAIWRRGHVNDAQPGAPADVLAAHSARQGRG